MVANVVPIMWMWLDIFLFTPASYIERDYHTYFEHSVLLDRKTILCGSSVIGQVISGSIGNIDGGGAVGTMGESVGRVVVGLLVVVVGRLVVVVGDNVVVVVEVVDVVDVVDVVVGTAVVVVGAAVVVGTAVVVVVVGGNVVVDVVIGRGVVVVVVVLGICVVVLVVVVGVGVVVVVAGGVVVIWSLQPTFAAKSHGGLAGLYARPFGHTPVLALPLLHRMKYLQPNGCL